MGLINSSFVNTKLDVNDIEFNVAFLICKIPAQPLPCWQTQEELESLATPHVAHGGHRTTLTWKNK